jgi:hypothetical protein
MDMEMVSSLFQHIHRPPDGAFVAPTQCYPEFIPQRFQDPQYPAQQVASALNAFKCDSSRGAANVSIYKEPPVSSDMHGGIQSPMILTTFQDYNEQGRQRLSEKYVQKFCLDLPSNTCLTV